MTNLIYVANGTDATVTVINGCNNQTTLVTAGADPTATGIDLATNKIDVVNSTAAKVTMIDGNTRIGGWRTRSVFERYAIVSQTDIADAMHQLEVQQNGHSFGHSRVERTALTVRILPLSLCHRKWCREGGSNPHDPKVGGF